MFEKGGTVTDAAGRKSYESKGELEGGTLGMLLRRLPFHVATRCIPYLGEGPRSCKAALLKRCVIKHARPKVIQSLVGASDALTVLILLREGRKVESTDG